MLKKRSALTALFSAALLILTLSVTACGQSDQGANGSAPKTAAKEISGQIIDGLRVLTVSSTAQDQHFTIYRGDYVRIETTSGEPCTIKIAALDVDKVFPTSEGDTPYFKVPQAGSFRFSVGEGRGVIEAVDFAATAYREVSPNEGATFIASANPLILDVRTPGEYESGHLANSVLIPVQEFQARVGELAQHKNDPVFVYCRSGNRSTVAAKILVDQGFTKVVNLRGGISEWRKTGLPVVK